MANVWALLDIVFVLGAPVYAGYAISKPLFSPRAPSFDRFVYGRKIS